MYQAVIVPVVLGLSNWLIRGGGLKQKWPNLRATKIVHDLIVTGLSYLIIPDWRFALAMGIAQAVGQAPALFHEDSDTTLAAKDVKGWIWVIAKRATVWAAPLALASVYWAKWATLYWLILIPAMPLCYSTVWWYKKVFKSTPWFNRWTVAEMSFGFIQGLVMALIYLTI